MIRINTSRVIATMKDPLSFRDWSIVNNPGKPVRRERLSVAFQLSVSEFMATCFPNPTGFGFINILPERLFRWNPRVVVIACLATIIGSVTGSSGWKLVEVFTAEVTFKLHRRTFISVLSRGLAVLAAQLSLLKSYAVHN